MKGPEPDEAEHLPEDRRPHARRDAQGGRVRDGRFPAGGEAARSGDSTHHGATLAERPTRRTSAPSRGPTPSGLTRTSTSETDTRRDECVTALMGLTHWVGRSCCPLQVLWPRSRRHHHGQVAQGRRHVGAVKSTQVSRQTRKDAGLRAEVPAETPACRESRRLGMQEESSVRLGAQQLARGRPRTPSRRPCSTWALKRTARSEVVVGRYTKAPGYSGATR